MESSLTIDLSVKRLNLKQTALEIRLLRQPVVPHLAVLRGKGCDAASQMDLVLLIEQKKGEKVNNERSIFFRVKFVK